MNSTQNPAIPIQTHTHARNIPKTYAKRVLLGCMNVGNLFDNTGHQQIGAELQQRLMCISSGSVNVIAVGGYDRCDGRLDALHR